MILNVLQQEIYGWHRIDTANILAWLNVTDKIAIRLNGNVFVPKMVPHSFVLSKVSVCLYLHLLGKRAMEKVPDYQASELYIIRYVDDILMYSARSAAIADFVAKMEKYVAFNREKMQGSAEVTPMIGDLEKSGGAPMLNSHVNFAGVLFDIETQSLRVPLSFKPIQVSDLTTEQDIRKIPVKIQSNCESLARYCCRSIFFKIGNNPEISLRAIDDAISSAVEICFVRLRRLLLSIPLHLRIRVFSSDNSLTKTVGRSIRNIMRKNFDKLIENKSKITGANESKVLNALQIEVVKMLDRRLYQQIHKLRCLLRFTIYFLFSNDLFFITKG